jgi:hypothetical protein
LFSIANALFLLKKFNLPGLGQRHDLSPLCKIELRAGTGLLDDSSDAVTGASGKRC